MEHIIICLQIIQFKRTFYKHSFVVHSKPTYIYLEETVIKYTRVYTSSITTCFSYYRLTNKHAYQLPWLFVYIYFVFSIHKHHNFIRSLSFWKTGFYYEMQCSSSQLVEKPKIISGLTEAMLLYTKIPILYTYTKYNYKITKNAHNWDVLHCFGWWSTVVVVLYGQHFIILQKNILITHKKDLLNIQQNCIAGHYV